MPLSSDSLLFGQKRNAMSKPIPQTTESTLLQIDLSAHLSAEELAAFLRSAEEAGRTPQEHFLAITLGDEKRAA